MTLRDQRLMIQVREGDVTAFESLVERHKGMVYALCYSLLRNREDAEEAAQDSFLKLFRRRDLFDPSRSVEPWLLRIAGNTCRDMLRRRRVAQEGERRRQESLENVLDPRDGQDARELTRQAVRHEIDNMSPRLREPLTLRYINELTNLQIADVLGISVSSVKQRLARAKDVLESRLREVLEA